MDVQYILIVEIMDSVTPFNDRDYSRIGIIGKVQEDVVKTINDIHLPPVVEALASLVSFPLQREREREREREEINKNLTCFVGAHTGQSVSDDSAGLWPFLGAAHKTFTEGEA